MSGFESLVVRIVSQIFCKKIKETREFNIIFGFLITKNDSINIALLVKLQIVNILKEEFSKWNRNTLRLKNDIRYPEKKSFMFD